MPSDQHYQIGARPDIRMKKSANRTLAHLPIGYVKPKAMTLH